MSESYKIPSLFLKVMVMSLHLCCQTIPKDIHFNMIFNREKLPKRIVKIFSVKQLINYTHITAIV